MSDSRVISLGDLPTAVPPSGSDTFAVCQNPAGCGETDLLSQMTLDQVAAFVLDQVPTPQYVSQIIPSAQQVALSSGNTVTLASVELPPGEWILTGEVWFALVSGNASNVTRVAAVIGPDQTIPTDPADDVTAVAAAPANAGVGIVLSLGWVYINTDVTVTYYLLVSAAWSGNVQMAAYGKIAGLFRSV